MNLNPHFVTRTRDGDMAVVTQRCQGRFTLLGYYTTTRDDDKTVSISTIWTPEGKFYAHPNLKSQLDLISVPPSP
jgi:FPC/CPF motif-containing protein YcgG